MTDGLRFAPTMDGADAAPAAPPAGRPAPGLRGRCHVRLFHDGGFLAKSDAVWKTKRFAATLLMAASGHDLDLEVEGKRSRHGMVAIRPFVTTQLTARDTPFVALDLSPDHRDYRAFTHIPGNGVMDVPRARFASLAQPLQEFHAGGMRGDPSVRLYRRITNLALTMLPPAAPLTPCVEFAKTTLARDASLSVTALSTLCDVSPPRLSKLFAQELGLSLRQYVQWLKIKNALGMMGSGLTLTEIAVGAGFADSAHFSKVWTQTYGASPAYFFSNAEVAVFPSRRSPRFRPPMAPPGSIA
ncbi:helix-turn-helix domain-containing protein [Piscinibacter gummiphilus]|uniref:helix-turn-helix domain-containing protein n=1 Tax=Piscinibacter gummiphilus TaxID=946333 RepID=UPI0012FE5361|nr:helix-turn-helix transcriptional regulator [Piscinibacter gummiphilus]